MDPPWLFQKVGCRIPFAYLVLAVTYDVLVKEVLHYACSIIKCIGVALEWHWSGICFLLFMLLESYLLWSVSMGSLCSCYEFVFCLCCVPLSLC